MSIGYVDSAEGRLPHIVAGTDGCQCDQCTAARESVVAVGRLKDIPAGPELDMATDHCVELLDRIRGVRRGDRLESRLKIKKLGGARW